MAVYFRKTLLQGPVRFSVAPRPDRGDDDASWSTSADGSFTRRGNAGLFYAATDPPNAADLERDRFDIEAETAMDWRSWASIGFGVLLLIIGPLVIIRKGGIAGWIEIILGSIFVVLPFVITWKKRRDIRRKIEEERRARAEEDARRRALLGNFTRTLQTLRSEGRGDLAAIRKERDQLDVPYEAVGPLARETVLALAFRWLAEEIPPSELASRIDEVAIATQLSDDDHRAVRRELHDRLFCHLLADDRLHDMTLSRLAELRSALGLAESDVVIDSRRAPELDRLRTINTKKLPRSEPSEEVELRFHEACVHVSPGTEVERRKKPGEEGPWKEKRESDLVITSRRLISHGRRTHEWSWDVPLDFEIDGDWNVLTVIPEGDEPRSFRIDDPVYTAGLMEIVRNIPRKPKGVV